jgi:hypothetical protein
MGQPLHLSPLDYNLSDFALLKEHEDCLRYVVSSIGRGRARLDTYPDHRRAKAALLLTGGTVYVKASRINRRILNTMRLENIVDLGPDSTPNGAEWSVKDAIDRLDGDLAKSAGGPSKWCGVVVGTVNELRAVAIPGNAVVIELLFEGSGAVLRSNGDVAGNGKGGHIRRRLCLTDSRRFKRGWRAGTVVLMSLGDDALESPQGRGWVGKDKSNIDAEGSERTYRVSLGVFASSRVHLQRVWGPL